VGTLWEGLHIYRKAGEGFRGYEHCGAFGKSSAELKQAEDMCRNTGVSLGAYGQG